MKRIFTHLFVAVLLMLSSTSWAQTTLEVGKVYHFQNAHFTGRAITAVDGNNASVQAAATDKNDIKQQWYVTTDGNGKYLFRNLSNARYLSQTAQSAWGLTEVCTENSNKFEYIVAGGTNNTIRSASVSGNGNAYMHLGSATQTNIQGWGSGSGGTQWTVTKIEYSDAQIKALLDAVPTAAEVAAYQPSLEALFTDGACSTPKLASLSEAQSSEAYAALPAALQRMVDKVYGGNWEEATVAPADRPNGNNNTNHSLWTVAETWGSDYAKKFRVQMYEPYSIESEVTSYLRINAHCNMDNPTGIYANSGDVIYIMVDGDIPEGAELWLAHQSGNGATQYYNNSAYTQLHKGLNRVTFTTDGCQMWINYVVHTYNADGATITEKFPENRKLSNYKPLKIHIEGGHINGFFNAMGDYRATTDAENLWGAVDNDEDWNYYKARVALPTDFALLGHRQTLLFPFGAYDSEKGYFGVANADGGIEKALAYHLENIKVVSTPNCYSGNGNGFGEYNDTYYPGMGLSTTNGKINIMLEAWDRITYSELASMGVVSTSTMDKMNTLYPRWTSEGTPAEIYNYGSATVDGDTKTYLEFCQGVDYSEYFNHHACGVGAGSGYMSGGWRVCNYHYNTMGSIIGVIANEAGPTWGPAHEIGHQHQAVFNLNGQTEVTNNFFSNVAVWYMGMGTSRVNGSEGSLESVLAAFNTEGNDLYTNNIWAITHLYYRLWLYYHLAGNNTQFWPRLFELCRQEPLINGGQISGETSLLRFYQHACNAAGEDLTEFFRAHGFFEIMDNRLVGDYSNATYNITQEQIDAAIAAVKAKNYPVNYAVLLVNDGTSETTKMHNGSTERSLWDNNPTAEFGSVNDFIDGDVAVKTNYSAVVNADGSITMSGGQGGVGFLVFNEKGELIAFSNKATFKLSDEALEAIVSGKATITTVDTESNVTTAEVDITAMQRTVLEQLIAKAQSIVHKVDDTYTKIGYFKGAAVADLASALAYAREVCEGSSGYEAAYDLLYAEYTKVLANTDSKIPFNPSLTYIITNYGNPAQTMWVNSENTVRSEGGVDQTSNDARWEFVETSTAGVYNIRTLNNDYIPAVQQSASMTATTGQADNDALYTLEEVKDGVWAIKLSPADGYRNLHSSWNNVVGWETGADASRWYLTAVEADPVIADLTDLEVYINKTELLLEEVLGTVTYTKGEALSLQTTIQNSAGYLWSNAPETREGNIANLVDGAANNYFHTDWSSQPVSGSHYLAVYLGEDNTLERFTFSHTTRSGASADFPKSVDVYGSDDNVTYKYIGSASGMPQSAGTAWEFDGVMLSSYKYLRFNYHANRGYWHMAEFDITPVTGFTATVNDTYSGTVSVDAVTAAMNALHNGKRTANGISPTTDDVAAKLSALQTAYNALYTQYEATINARKATLAQLVAETETLINQVGNVAFSTDEEKLILTTSNFYCNDPHLGNGNDDSENYVSKLTDGNTDTYLHTDYNNTNTGGFPHYLRIDLGENCTATGFKFTYTTRNNGNDCPTEIVVAGCDTPDGEYATICTLRETDAVNPLPNGVSLVYASSEISRPSPYRYIRLTVTKTENRTNSYFVISEFGFTTVEDKVEVTVNNAYKNFVTDELLLTTVHTTNSSKSMSTNALVTSVPLLDAQIADQQAAKTALEEAMSSTNTLKDELNALLAQAEELHRSIIDLYGDLSPYYSNAIAYNDFLAFLQEMQDASTVANNNEATADEIKTAYDELKSFYDEFQVIKSTDFTGDRTAIQELVAKMETLLAEVADKTTAKTAIALQTTDDESDFYIWSNATAWDCNGIGALIDKNDDGTANTGTFFGTTWDSGTTVNNYDHYITVDLGTEIALNELSLDYTTRNSTHANQRPTSIKVLGSNDKEGEYAEITTLSEGMPVGQCAKWEMSSAVALNSYYRYIRFAVATDAGYFNMSDFNLYAHSAVETNDDYLPSGITGAQLFAMNAALLAGIDARDKFVTEDNYNAALTALQTQYDALLAIKNANVIDRNSLADLITETNTLIKEVATVSEEEVAIAMQCTDVNAPYYLYCNADGTETNGDGDKLGVTALLDNDANTHLHTTYGNKAQDDDLDHYLRLDMGKNEAMMSFKFSYTGRSSNSNNDPSTMVIEGCNTLDGEWAEIVTLTGLPTDGDGVQYNSELIKSDKAYRYIRFMVTKTQNGKTNNGHPFFVLSKFSVTACKTIEVKTEYVSPNLPLSTLVTANNEVVDATVIKKQFYVTETVYNTAVDELQAAKNALEAAIALKNIPVKLTTDVNNPVLYKIIINRDNDGNKRLKYDEASAMVAVDDAGMDRNQAWYFMSGDDPTKDILILPYMGEGKVLATNSFSEGDSKVQVVESTADGYSNNWNIVAIADSEWSNITILNGSGATFYFSNHGGVGHKMGFYNHSDDVGSQFKFVLDDTDYSLPDSYYLLYNLHNDCGGEKTEGNKIGQYAETTDYNAAYSAATTLLENKSATEDEYATAYETLSAAFEALKLNLPVEGGLYIIKSANSNAYSAGKQIYVDAENKPYFDAPASENENLSKYIWQFEPVDGGFMMKSLHTQSYVSGAAWATQVTLSDDDANAKTVTIGVLDDATGQISITVSGGYPLHAQDAGSQLVGYTGGANSASAWYIEEVGDLTTIKHTVSLGANESGSDTNAYSTLYLAYNAKIPEGITASIVEEINEIGQLVLTPVTGGILPANTAVVLSRETAGDVDFLYTDEEPTFDPTGNMLRGASCNELINCGDEHNVYMLAKKSGRVAFYWTYENRGADGNYVYINADKEIVASTDTGAHRNHNKGGYVRCNANKAYLLERENSGQAAVAMYSFFLGGATTELDEVEGENGQVNVIYDLQGRKLVKVTSPGIYIVNGKKVYITEIED